jgi:hypothetical protein
MHFFLHLLLHGFDHRNFSIQRYVHNIGAFLGMNANAITGLEFPSTNGGALPD